MGHRRVLHRLRPRDRSVRVKPTVLEPGGMRTDWAGSSMTIPQPSKPYQLTIGPLAKLIRATSGHEATDPRRVAQLGRDLAGPGRCRPRAAAARHRRCADGAADSAGTRHQRRSLARPQPERQRWNASGRRGVVEPQHVARRSDLPLTKGDTGHAGAGNQNCAVACRSRGRARIVPIGCPVEVSGSGGRTVQDASRRPAPLGVALPLSRVGGRFVPLTLQA